MPAPDRRVEKNFARPSGAIVGSNGRETGKTRGECGKTRGGRDLLMRNRVDASGDAGKC
jgi:hypothetical protein